MTKPQLTRRDFLKQTVISGAAAAVGTSLLGQSARALPPARKPNLVFLFSDQHAFDMVGCNGNSQVLTPNIDRLASQGTNFRHAIANCSVCTPSRGTLLSGKHPLRHGAFGNDVQMLPGNGNHFGEILRDAGYNTSYIGKWHLLGGDRNRPIPAGPLRYGFDDELLTNNCTVDFRPGHAFYWNDAGQKVIFNKWEADGQTDQAIDFLNEQDAETPFALFLSWHPPHDMGRGDDGEYNYATEPDLMALYADQTLQLRGNVADTPVARRQYQGYMAMISGIDRCVGRVMDKLDAMGVTEDTLLIYTSDHGDLLGSHLRPRPKGFPEQESIRVPLMIRYPGHVQAGATSDLMFGLLDMMPSVLGLLDIPIPPTCQGLDLSTPIKTGDQDFVESVPLYFFEPSWRGVYTREFTFAFDDAAVAPLHEECHVLYDHVHDRWELNNLFDQDTPLKRHALELAMRWVNHFEDPCPSTADLKRLCGLPSTPLGVPGQDGKLTQTPLESLAAGGFRSFAPEYTGVKTASLW